MKSTRRIQAFMILCMLSVITCRGITAKTVCLDAPVCKTPPVLDGKPNDPQWEKAEKIPQLYLVNTGKPAPETKLWIMRDNSWLYIAADCRNPHLSQLQQVAKAHDGGVNLDDSLEIFVRPSSSDDTDYYHFLLNPWNIRKEQRCRMGGLRDTSWNPPWRTATVRTDHGWNAEIAIPLFLVTGENPADMRINICRNLADVELDDKGVVVKETMVWSTIRSDNKGGFHDAGNTVLMGGMEQFKADLSVFAPQILAAHVVSTHQEGRKNVYDLRLTLDAATDVPGAAEIAVIEDFGDGEKTVMTMPEDLKGRTRLDLQVPCDNLLPRIVKVMLRDPGTGLVLAENLLGRTDLACVISRDNQPFYTQKTSGSAHQANYLVAAADAPDRVKAQADFLCQGKDDHVVINAAIEELPATGGHVHLSAGTFSIGGIEGTRGGISIFRSNVLLTGEGTGTRLILQDGLTDINVIWIYERDGFIDDVTIRDLYINGNKDNQTRWSRARSGWKGNNGVKSSGFWGALGRTPRNIRVENCRIENCVLMAVMLTGENVEVIDCYFTGNFGSHVIELLGDSGRIDGCTLRVKDGETATFGFATDHSHFYHIVNNKIMVDKGGRIGSHPINNWPPHRYGGATVTNQYHGIISGNMVINNGQTGPVRIQGYMDMVNNNIFRDVPVLIAGMGVVFEHNLIINGSLEIDSADHGSESRIFVDGNNFFNSDIKYKQGDVVWGTNPGAETP